MLPTIFQIVFAGLALISFVLMFVKKQRRPSYFIAGCCAVIAAAGSYYDSFWVLASFGLIVPWALFTTIPILDMGWRVKAGLALLLLLGSGLAIYPTFYEERYGKIDYSTLSPEERATQSEAAEKGELGLSRYLLANMDFRLVRGLDLKGGLRLVYNVDVDEAIKDRRDRFYEDMRLRLAREYKILTEDETPSPDKLKQLNDKVTLKKSRDESGVFSVSFASADDGRRIANEEFLKPLIRDMTIVKSEDGGTITFRINGDVESFIRSEAVKRAKEQVLRRIDVLGLKEASVSPRNEDIIVEVPGDDDAAFDDIREIIGQTARLEFKLVDDEADFFADVAKSFPADKLPQGLRFELQNAPVGEGKTKPIYVAVMVRGEGETMKETLARFQKWVDENLDVPDTHEIGFKKEQEFNDTTGQWEFVRWQTYYLFDRAELTGDMIEDAQARPDPSETGFGRWEVSMTFNSEGAAAFERITETNIQRRFAIMLDGQVESAPVIQSAIRGGQGRITLGQGDPEQQVADARKLELVLRSGALPAPITPVKEDRIGPTLGQDSIDQGVRAALISAGLVLLAMFLYYRRAGLIANAAVMFNVILQFAVLTMFSASLTLPGIAGLALTIGVAVDANVLINERIREELRMGKTARSAVDTGYERAFSAIIDGHITGIITGLILAQFGSGPIKGFAVTTIVGLTTSLFTGVVVTRLFFDFFVRFRKQRKLSLGQG